MKKLLFLSAIIIALSSCDTEDKVIITGNVKNPVSNEVEAFYYKDHIMNEKESMTFELDDVNSFVVRMPLEDNRFVYINMPPRTVRLYINPNSRVYVEFDMEKPDEMPYISGEHAHESIFLVSYNYEIERQYNTSYFINQMLQKTSEEFSELMKENKTLRKDFLKNSDHYEMLDEDFVDYMKNAIRYAYYSYLMMYPHVIERFLGEEKAAEIPEEYFSFLEKENLFNEDLIDIKEYRDFIENYVGYATSDIPYGDGLGSIYNMQFNYVKDNFTGKNREYLLSKLAYMSLSIDDFKESELLYKEYIELVEAGVNQNVVTTVYENILGLLPGNPAPDFTLYDIDNEPVSMSDFLGKVVYLDFWASWCGPCMREVPFAKELKERMKDQEDLVFLYISIDTNPDEWKKSVYENEIKGVHLNVPGRMHEVPASYNVRFIPTFYVIGRDGKIFDNKPPRPSNENVDSIILKALGE